MSYVIEENDFIYLNVAFNLSFNKNLFITKTELQHIEKI